MSIRKSKARKLAEFLRNITAEAKLTTEAVQDDKVVTTGADLDSKSTDTTALVSAASVTSYVGDKLDDYVHSTHDINLTFTGDVTGHGTITDMSHTSFALTLDAETLPVQTDYAGKFLTTDGTTASWATVDTSNGDTAYSWGDHAQEGYLTSFTETDPTVPSHVKAITTTDISQWEDAYSWGDHSQEGYLTSETNDYVDSVSFSISNGVLSLGRTGSLPDLTVDLDGRYLQSFTETTTNLVDNGDNTITYTNEQGTAQTIDLSLYLDDTNLARILSGTMNSSGVATFTRDDDTTFTVDMSVLLDDTNLSRITSASWNTSNGVLTLTRNDNTTVAVDLDGRYVQKNADIVVANAGPSLTLTDTTDSDDHRIAFRNSSTELHSINTISSRLNIDSTQDIKVNRNGTKILDIVSSGLNVTGTVNATSFSGNLDYNDITNPPTIDNSVDYINSANFNTSTGVLTLSGVGRAGATIDLDGRYLRSETDSQTLSWNGSNGQLSISNGNTVDLDGRYAQSSSLGNYMPIQNSTPYTIPTATTWGSYNLGNGTMMQASGTGKPSGSTHGYWYVIGKRDTVGGYAGLYVNSYQDAGRGLWIGRNDVGTDAPSWERVFTEDYHPNADKWTTARTNTVTLTGDASGSGSASVDGTGNWTVSVPVVVNNDSHTHDGRYVNVTGDTMTGNLNFSDDAEGITWNRNTDGASILFYNDSDGDTNSRLEFNVRDNGNEFFRWTSNSAEWMKLIGSNLSVGKFDIVAEGSQGTYMKGISSISFNDSSSSWTSANNHGIRSTGHNGSFGDDISINSYHDVTIRLDTNSNNTGSYLRVVNDSTALQSGNDNLPFWTGHNGSGAVSRVWGNLGINAEPRTDTYRLNMGGHIHMKGNHIHFANEVHFNSGTRFKDNSDSTLLFKAGSSSAAQIALQTNGTTRGALYADSSNAVGILDEGGNWGIRHRNDSGSDFLNRGNTLQASIGADLVTGTYGSMAVYEYKNGWAGYSIDNKWVFMSNGTDSGIYNDIDNEWAVNCARNGAVTLYHNGSSKLVTLSTGVEIRGNLTVEGSISQSDGFGTLYTFNTTQALSTSWANVSAISGSTLPTGTYAIQIKVYNHDAGGGNYDEHYSGTMAWYGSGTNDGDSNEIPLHNAGHAYNGAAIYARTLRRYSSTMILQLAASGSISSDAIEIKIRRLI